MKVDLNADVGEGWDDEALMPFLTSVNVACGGHAGDREAMSRTIEAAKRWRLAVGAHPGYVDREHFGRRELSLRAEEAERIVIEQIETLAAVARGHGVALTHVKPHGALYNQAARDPALARAVAEAVRKVSPRLALVGLSGSAVLTAGKEAGLRVFAEAFADRRYRPDGQLAPRGTAGSVIEDPEEAAEQALAIVRGKPIRAMRGGTVRIRADTLCLHGDTPQALAIARAVHRKLEEAGIELVGESSRV